MHWLIHRFTMHSFLHLTTCFFCICWCIDLFIHTFMYLFIELLYKFWICSCCSCCSYALGMCDGMLCDSFTATATCESAFPYALQHKRLSLSCSIYRCVLAGFFAVALYNERLWFGNYVCVSCVWENYKAIHKLD